MALFFLMRCWGVVMAKHNHFISMEENKSGIVKLFSRQPVSSSSVGLYKFMMGREKSRTEGRLVGHSFGWSVSLSGRQAGRRSVGRSISRSGSHVSQPVMQSVSQSVSQSSWIDILVLNG